MIAALLTTAVVALAMTSLVAPRLDCARTPVSVSADTQGASLQQVRALVARDHATRPRRVDVVRDGTDARELRISDGDGRHHLGSVRVVRASGDGWVVATTNTCGD